MIRKAGLLPGILSRPPYSTRTAAQTISSTRFSEAAPEASWNALPGKGSQASREVSGSG